jgi:GTP pyrophosphokinase
VNELIDTIISEAKKYLPHPTTVEKEIRRAFEFAAKAHEGQFRKSGEPYITHPVHATAHLMALHPDLASIQACLLHDVPEDTKVSLKEIEQQFGSEVMKLTAAMTKLGKIKYRGEERSIENLRKMFLAISKDLRIAFIKLCDRLHNMETIHFHPEEEKRKRIALETLSIYAPIAARLGIYTIKDQLEDWCFKTLYPEDYDHIVQELNQKSKQREKYLTLAQKQLQKVLQAHHIDATIIGRVKKPYSIFKKLQKKNLTSINELYDLFALRVIVKDKATCYAVLGIIHEHFTPLSSRFKDYIAVPKANNYQSLHTTVVGLGKEIRDQPTEIQIRTYEMDKEAEFGIAAHFLYKEQGSRKVKSNKIEWIKTLEQVSHTYQDHQEFLESLQTDVFSDRIFVFTPQGDVKDLPAGSTPIDFAYAIHSDIGHRCKGAKVDGVIVPLHYELESGEVVEILTRKDPQPNQYWLSFVRTSSARAKIKAWFREQNKENIIKLGKELFNKQLARLGKLPLDPEYTILKELDGKNLDFSAREHILESIGNGSVNAISIIKKIFPPIIPNRETGIATSSVPPQSPEIIIAGEKGIQYKLSACCMPKPKDKVIAYVTRGRNVSIHRSNCKMILGLDKKRFIPASWKEEQVKPVFQSRLYLKVRDGVGVLKDILDIIYKQNVSISDISVERNTAKKEADLTIDVDINDYEVFDRLIALISLLKHTISVDGKILR